MANIPFSSELETWLKSKDAKTVGDMQAVFGEKSFAIIFLLFMFVPSLPVPTGGVTQFILLPITMLSALQMMFGRRALWLPWRLKNIELGSSLLNRGLPFMMRRIRWFERFSRTRQANYLDTTWFRTQCGLAVFLFAVASFIAPPFSGLDTLPSMGGVIIALSILLEDIMLYFVGLVVGGIGIGLMITAANIIVAFLEKIF